MSEQTDPRAFVHRIDRSGRISFVNDDWLAFAHENDYQVSATEVLGSPLMASICDAQTRHIYEMLVRRVRESTRSLEFGYRCDSPECRRWLHMQMRYLWAIDEVEFTSSVVRLEPRAPVSLLDLGQRRRGDQTLSVCSWCKSVLVDQAWVEVEQALQRLRVFAADVVPQISHGICPECRDRMAWPETSP